MSRRERTRAKGCKHKIAHTHIHTNTTKSVFVTGRAASDLLRVTKINQTTRVPPAHPTHCAPSHSQTAVLAASNWQLVAFHLLLTDFRARLEEKISGWVLRRRLICKQTRWCNAMKMEDFIFSWRVSQWGVVMIFYPSNKLICGNYSFF